MSASKLCSALRITANVKFCKSFKGGNEGRAKALEKQQRDRLLEQSLTALAGPQLWTDVNTSRAIVSSWRCG